MKKVRLLVLAAALTLAFSLLVGCDSELPKEPTYDSGVVKAFKAITPDTDVISQTATADGQTYLVTLITDASVVQYRLDAQFEVDKATAIVGDSPTLTAETVEGASDVQRAFETAIELSGISKADVQGFDFDRDVYMGKDVFKVEIEDSVAEYSYIFRAEDMSLEQSKVELKSPSVAGGSSYIGDDAAKTIALRAVGIEAAQAKNLTQKSVLSDGKKIYKISFDYDGYRYSLDIDAVSGDIVKMSKNILDETAGPAVPSIVTRDEAKQTALAFAFPNGTDGVRVEFRKVKLDYEDGAFVYEIEFVTDAAEYEFEISAASGEIVDFEIEPLEERRASEGKKFISRDEAASKALAMAGEGAILLEVDIEKEFVSGETRYFYEVTVKVGGVEKEYYVDALSGDTSLNEQYEGNPLDPTISAEQAMEIALKNFQLTENDITSHRIKLEMDNGRLCYEIDLYVGRKEYSIDIDAHNGVVLEREIDDEDDVPPAASGSITEEQARAAVKALAGDNAVIKDVEFDDEGVGQNKRYFYEVEVVKDGIEYEYYVDAVTGVASLKGEIIGSGKDLIGESRAISIALERFGFVQSEVRFLEVKLDEDDGILLYEVEFMVKNMEYTAEIDACSGKILDTDVSYD